MRLLLLAALLLAQSAPSRPPAFAVVYSDGSLEPFAVFDGRRWIDPMPRTPGSFTGNPQTLQTHWRRHGIQVPRDWRIASGKGDEAWDIAVTEAVGAESDIVDCYGLMFRTNAPQLSDNEAPRRLAYTGGRFPIRAAIDLRGTSDTAPWQDMIDVVLREFPAHEGAAIRKWRSANPKASPRAATALSGRVELGALYADRQGDRRLLYFEATREHSGPLNVADAHCNGITSVQGWVEARGGGRPAVVVLKSLLSDCDQVEGTWRRPLGIVTIHGDKIWLFEEGHYEGTSYALFSTRRRIRRLLQSWAGGC